MNDNVVAHPKVKLHEVLGRAMELIEVGWTQGVPVRWVDDTESPSYCLYGALDDAGYQMRRLLKVGPGTKLSEVLDRVVRDYFPDRCWASGPTVIHFNDHPSTTKEDVLLVMKHARVILEEEGV